MNYNIIVSSNNSGEYVAEVYLGESLIFVGEGSSHLKAMQDACAGLISAIKDMKGTSDEAVTDEKVLFELIRSKVKTDEDIIESEENDDIEDEENAIIEEIREKRIYRKYPTERQEKYIKDMMQIFSNQIIVISDSISSLYTDSNDSLRVTKAFNLMSSSDEVHNFINILSTGLEILGKVCYSIDHKDDKELNNLMSKDYFKRWIEPDLKIIYRELSEYVILPGYEEFSSEILGNLNEEKKEFK